MQAISNRNISARNYKILQYAELDSTLLEAERLFQSGERDDCLVIAESQKSGFGKFNRKWHSPPGNIYLTIIKKISMPINEASRISLITSLAIIDCLKEILPSRSIVNFKWPNDVLVNEKKISGVLLKAFSEGNNDFVDHIFIGVGLNLSSHPSDLPYQATSIYEEADDSFDYQTIIEKIVSCFEHIFEQYKQKGFSFVRESLEKKAYNLGKNIVVKQGDKKISGVFRKIDNNGNLLIIEDNGDEKIISNGDVLLK